MVAICVGTLPPRPGDSRSNSCGIQRTTSITGVMPGWRTPRLEAACRGTNMSEAAVKAAEGRTLLAMSTRLPTQSFLGAMRVPGLGRSAGRGCPESVGIAEA